MFGTVISLLVIVVIGGGWYLTRYARQRHDERSMYVPTHPDIELSQRYGGWDADAYDAGSTHHTGGHHTTEAPQRPAPTNTNQGFGRR